VTLDLVKVAEKLPALVERAQRERKSYGLHRVRALAQLRSAADQPEEFAALVQNADTSWQLAIPFVGRPDTGYDPPDPPDSFSVLAVDGSSIDVDRHLPVDCYVMNFGWMAIHYGAEPGAESGTEVDLQPTGEELFLRDNQDPSRESAIAGPVLAVVRSVRELATLADHAEALVTPGRPLLALVDGNLALWNLDKPEFPPSIADELKYGERGVIRALNRLRDLASAGLVLFSGFVSRTGAGNLVHSLRLTVCPLHPQVVCRNCPGLAERTRPCDSVGLPSDREIMGKVLRPWQRSAVFKPWSRHRSRRGDDWYTDEGHEIVFFYLRAGDEIARIELPIWMVEDPLKLDLLHALLVHQAQEGGEYPIALQEAHEQAVISGNDRVYFNALVERQFELNGIPWVTSAKALSKRVRVI
jgi:hypothetical protein